ncbi:hypothetical protein GKZ89_14930 [Bacillus mangrovi]|uniref:Uncharacterized protein n=1 Tax=Metabacillus mangrovi TaxID=1491830 RepID=A0A7X2S742_9BACI|nr:hypothetical protein [Metabacillus mangrovi]MTH54695.1 hypothetical protein [Metabacillus mangrovi]
MIWLKTSLILVSFAIISVSLYTGFIDPSQPVIHIPSPLTGIMLLLLAVLYATDKRKKRAG